MTKGISIADMVVIVAYLVGTTILGLYLARKIKNMGDFFMPRKYGKWLIMFHAFGTGTSSEQAVSAASKTYTNGVSGIWFQWLWLFATPFYWITAPIMRRFRAITTADVFEVRYNRWVAIVYSLIAVIYSSLALGTMLKGSAAVIDGSTGGMIDGNVGIIILTVLFLVYGIAGGLPAAIVTDFIQGILTVVFSFMLLPPVMSAVGGISGLHDKIQDSEMFSLIAPSEIGVFYVVMLAINSLLMNSVIPHIMGNCGVGRTEKESQVGFVAGNFLKRICTMAWTITGLAAVVYLSGREGVKPDEVYGIMAMEFFPVIMPGLLGIFIAALLAAVMSTCDSMMISSSALFTENCYKPIFKEKSEKHYLMVGRLASLGVVIIGVIFAYSVKGIIEAIELLFPFLSICGIAFWMGYLWRKANTYGAFASMISGYITWFVSRQGWFVDWLNALPSSDSLGFIFVRTYESLLEDGSVLVEKSEFVYIPWQLLMILSVSLFFGVLFSLIKKEKNEDRLKRYFEVCRTPTQLGEELTEVVRLPEGAIVGRNRKMFPGTSLEIQIPTVRTVVGFALCSLIVFLMIFTFRWIIS